MNLTKFYTADKFGLLIDLRSMADQAMHGSGTRLVSSKDGVQLELEQNASGSDEEKCHVFVISDSKMGILGQQLESVQYWYNYGPNNIPFNPIQTGLFFASQDPGRGSGGPTPVTLQPLMVWLPNLHRTM